MCLLQVSKLLEKSETGSVIIPTRNNSKNSDKNFISVSNHEAWGIHANKGTQTNTKYKN